MVREVFAPALPGRRSIESTSPVASAKHPMGWKPIATFVVGSRALLFSECTAISVASMSSTTGRCGW